MMPTCLQVLLLINLHPSASHRRPQPHMLLTETSSVYIKGWKGPVAVIPANKFILFTLKLVSNKSSGGLESYKRAENITLLVPENGLSNKTYLEVKFQLIH